MSIPQTLENNADEQYKLNDAAEDKDSGEELDPSKLDVRVGKIVKCWNHPDSDKLLCEVSELSGCWVMCDS